MGFYFSSLSYGMAQNFENKVILKILFLTNKQKANSYILTTEWWLPEQKRAVGQGGKRGSNTS